VVGAEWMVKAVDFTETLAQRGQAWALPHSWDSRATVILDTVFGKDKA